MDVNPAVLRLAGLPEYLGLTDEEAASLANTPSIPRSDDRPKTYPDIREVIGVDAIQPLADTLRANNRGWVADLLAGRGARFDIDDMQDGITALEAAGKIPPPLAHALKGIGRWLESPYEVETQRGQSCTAQDFTNARAVMRRAVLFEEIRQRYNRLFAAIDAGTVTTSAEAIVNFADALGG